MLSKDAVAKQFKEHLDISKRGMGNQWTNIEKCQAAYDGDFMNYNSQLSILDARTGRAKTILVQFNKIKPYVNSVKGFMAQNRRKPQCVARILDNKLQEVYSQYANAQLEFHRD